MLAADPADRPTMADVRDELAPLAAGRDGDTTTVLLARTELGSSSGRDRTEAFAGEPAAAAAAAPAASAKPATRTWDQPTRTEVAAPPAEPVVPTPPPPPAPEPGNGRRRRGGIWVAAAVLAVLLVGLIVFFVARPGDEDPRSNASATTGAASSTAGTTATTSSPQTSAEQSAEETSSSSEETTSSAPPTTAAAADPLTASNIEDFLVSYHAQVLSDPRGAYARTGPTLRAAISENNYVKYWRQFSDVRVSDIKAEDGKKTATGTLTWTYEDGRVESGVRRFTFLVQDGELLLDSDRGA
jgi:hypothetical protein